MFICKIKKKLNLQYTKKSFRGSMLLNLQSEDEDQYIQNKMRRKGNKPLKNTSWRR